MRLAFQIILPLVVLIISGFIVTAIVSNPNKPKTRKVEQPIVYVQSINAKSQDHSVVIETQGEARPKISSKIIPEVSGKVVKISDNFFEGKFFKKDEVLVEIDSRDYEISLAKAQAELVKMKTALEQEKIRTKNFETALANAKNTLQKNILTYKEEEARGQQALADWKKLGRSGTPGELVLRKPQMEAAKAAVEAAKADIEKAQRDLTLVDTLIANAKAAVEAAKATVRQCEINLERCTITAPFDGRIVSKSVDLGQYVSPGNSIAMVYSIEAMEIRLPIIPGDLEFMSLPDDKPGKNSEKIEVDFIKNIGSSQYSWKGFLDRTDSMVDSKSRQYYVIGQVDKPFEGEYSLKPGSFVKAKIKGKTINDVYLIPVSAIRQNSHVWVIDNESKLKKKDVKILRRKFDTAIVKGLSDGDRVCTTTLTFARNGLVVQEKKKKAEK